jgi:hypothetical protein
MHRFLFRRWTCHHVHQESFMRFLARLILAALGVHVSFPAELSAQAVATRSLTVPVASSTAAFTLITGVRELSNGNLIVLDQEEKSIVLFDAGLSGPTVLGRQGTGPGEYQNPSSLLRLAGDTTGVTDGSRIMIIAPDGKSGEAVDIFGRASPNSSSAGVLSSAYSADARGFLYAEASNGTVERVPGGLNATVRRYAFDSSAIERWPIRGSAGRDTVAYFKVIKGSTPVFRRPDQVIGYYSTSSPFQTAAQWAVAGDGRIAFVYPDPYRVEIVDVSGRRMGGQQIPYQSLPLAEAHKEQWLAERAAANDRLVRSWVTYVRPGAPPAAANAQVPIPVDSVPSSWPARLPPFLHGAARFAPDGRLWVRRTTAAGAPALFDVFDVSAEISERITLPAGLRLVGFGRNSVYAVRRDSNDLEYLLRFDLRGSR